MSNIKYILIKADTNDADFITKSSVITDEEIEKIRPLVKAISEFKPYTKSYGGINYIHHNNYPSGECCREYLGEKPYDKLYGHIDGLDLFDCFVPYDEYGIHTIESVEIVTFNESLLN